MMPAPPVRAPSADYPLIFSEIGALVRQMRGPSFTDHVRRLMTSLFDPQSVIVLLFENRRSPHVISQWIPDADLRMIFEESYFDHGYFLDPFYERAMSGFEDGAFRLRDIAPDRFFRSEYYRRYYRLTRMVDELGCLARLNDGRVAHLSIGRNEGRPKFSRKDYALLCTVAPAVMSLIVEHCSQIASPGDDVRPEPARKPLKEQLLYTKLDGGRRISKRESEVASLVVQGHSTTAIGLILNISPQTVKVHRRNIYRKLSISSQTELFAQFVKQRGETVDYLIPVSR